VTTTTRRIAEIVAALLSGGVHFVTTLGFAWHGVDQLVLGGGWIGYVLWRARTPGTLAGWGLRREGFRPCVRAATIAFAIGAVACAAIGAALGQLTFDAGILPLLLLYPLWGLVQQLIVLGIVAGNLDAMHAPRVAVVAVAALGFGAVHVPDWPLCGATLVLGVVACLMFLRWRNLWALGVLHGWLGALFYRWVLGRDPWAELIAALG